MGELYYDVPLGAFPSASGSLFRVFAPNALRLEIRHGKSPNNLGERIAAEEVSRGLWEARTEVDLRGYFYGISIEPLNKFSIPEKEFAAILDPYALACYDSIGTAIAIDHSTLPIAMPHRTAALCNSVILEGHLRDLLGLAPCGSDGATYGEFCRWLESDKNYLMSLGINVLELQPLQEFEGPDGAYHWGYMPVNYFSPSHCYASDGEHASQISEFAELVSCCHQKSMALIMDVVYNHVGNPNALRMLAGDYFFRTCSDGTLSNCSGCGNDLRTEAPMARKLILDSLQHLLTAYGVDGFRFDLAELIDGKTRCAIEEHVRRLRPDAILIAEPWSFRGHCAMDMRETSWSFWNDDFRDSIRRYVMGQSGSGALHYFIGGCTSHLTRIPQQSINYCASHDDHCWIDSITENGSRDGEVPTELDIGRSKLFIAIMFSCLGVPMLAQGQDFLHSKRGNGNTYLRGDLNALSWARLEKFATVHSYAADWIRFRLSERGRLLRLSSAPSQTFFQYFAAEDSTAATAILYNGDNSEGDGQLLLLVNPELRPITLSLSNLQNRDVFHAVAGGNGCFTCDGVGKLQRRHEVEPLCCELWARE